MESRKFLRQIIIEFAPTALKIAEEQGYEKLKEEIIRIIKNEEAEEIFAYIKELEQLSKQ